MNDIMIDIETLGTGNDAVVTAIGAVVFDIEKGTLGPTFYSTLHIQDQLDKGRKITESTLRWWLTQDRKVLEESIKVPLTSNKEILEWFSSFLIPQILLASSGTVYFKNGSSTPYYSGVPVYSGSPPVVEIPSKVSPESIQVWGNGSMFDISILESLFQTYGMKEPWSYRSPMDLRTFKRFLGKHKKIKGINHNALEDAKAQANFVIECLKG